MNKLSYDLTAGTAKIGYSLVACNTLIDVFAATLYQLFTNSVVHAKFGEDD